ncbi:hypothetical protein CEXT_418211 [Caerostris extrusa]|uniref:Uncharacterized protein n=1 Tax=Caerostris extrusa TaxID=172846 RepID=A0AAV4X1I1_CAEEX|nr:hypothetical protein CEXT_418211 [Caerostris extrusa]
MKERYKYVKQHNTLWDTPINSCILELKITEIHSQHSRNSSTSNCETGSHQINKGWCTCMRMHSVTGTGKRSKRPLQSRVAAASLAKVEVPTSRGGSRYLCEREECVGEEFRSKFEPAELVVKGVWKVQ